MAVPLAWPKAVAKADWIVVSLPPFSKIWSTISTDHVRRITFMPRLLILDTMDSTDWYCRPSGSIVSTEPGQLTPAYETLAPLASTIQRPDAENGPLGQAAQAGPAKSPQIANDRRRRSPVILLRGRCRQLDKADAATPNFRACGEAAGLYIPALPSAGEGQPHSRLATLMHFVRTRQGFFSTPNATRISDLRYSSRMGIILARGDTKAETPLSKKLAPGRAN